MVTTTSPIIKYKEKLDKLEGDFFKAKKKSIGKSLSAPISLKGVWKGVRISEKDIRKTKKGIFQGIVI